MSILFRGVPNHNTQRALRLFLMLAPALAVVIFLFIGGLALALLQSVGYMPIIGRYDVTLDAYRNILSRPDFYQSLLQTIWIASASTLLSTILALVSALALRRAFYGRRTTAFIFQLNIPIPHIVGAVGILFLFSQSGFLSRLAYMAGLIQEPANFPALVYDPYAIGIILEYVWKSTCFIGIILLAVLHSIGDEYEQAARTLGADSWQRFRHVLLPLLLPGIMSASILVFAFTFGAFEVPLLLGQRFPSALPVLAYRSYTDVDLNARPEAMAMSMLVALVVTLFIFMYMKLTRYYWRG